MNKRQMLVVWISAIAICLFIFMAPKYYVTCSKERCITWEHYLPGSFTKVKWYAVCQESLIVLILGGLAVFSLKDKK
jgi:hypothetical protein